MVRAQLALIRVSQALGVTKNNLKNIMNSFMLQHINEVATSQGKKRKVPLDFGVSPP